MTPLPRNTILLGDALTQLAHLPSASIDMSICSPPYFQLRNYGAPGQIGLEQSVDDWVERLVKVFEEVGRVLKDHGSLWLNLGDSYSRAKRFGAPPKGMLCAPERLLLALASQGWLVRNKVIYAKRNPLPTSTVDRLNTTYEVLYFLTRSPNYYFNLDSIREPHSTRRGRKASASVRQIPNWAGPLAGSQDGLRRARPDGLPGHPLGKNPGDVWFLATQSVPGHHATFPEALVNRPILAASPKALCSLCGEPWESKAPVRPGHMAQATDPACSCSAEPVRAVVLDPFMGSGTVAIAAQRHGRDWLGIELNPHYRRLALRRIHGAHGRMRFDQAA